MAKKKSLAQQIEGKLNEFFHWHSEIGKTVFYGNKACSHYDLIMGYDAEYRLNPNSSLIINHRRNAHKELMKMNVQVVINNGVFFYGENSKLAQDAYEKYLDEKQKTQIFNNKILATYGWELPFLEKYKIRFSPDLMSDQKHKIDGWYQLVYENKILASVQTWNAFEPTQERIYIEDVAGFSIFHYESRRNKSAYSVHHHFGPKDIFIIKFEADCIGEIGFGRDIAPEFISRFFVKISPYWEFAKFCSMMLNDIPDTTKIRDIRILDAYCERIDRGKTKSMFTRNFESSEAIKKGQIDLFAVT